MAWNHPGNNGNDRDPWGSNSSKDRNSVGDKDTKGTYDRDPPDLDEIFHNIIKKFSKLGIGKRKLKNKPPENVKLFSIIIFLGVIIWFSAGFYTVKESERGVVTRFGKFNHLVAPGLNWKPIFLDKINIVNLGAVRELSSSGKMFTSDENVVKVKMNVQYRVTNPVSYLYSVNNADETLKQVTDSTLRGVIGCSTMDRILTEGSTMIRAQTEREINETIQQYNMGITLVDVNFQASSPAEEVKLAFDDVITARVNRQQYIHEAEDYVNTMQLYAKDRVHRIIQTALVYKQKVILEAKSEVARFEHLLPQYKTFPNITKEHLYFDSMERIFNHTNKILINDHGKNIFVLPLGQLMKKSRTVQKYNYNSHDTTLNKSNSSSHKSTNAVTKTHDVNNNIMEQRRTDAVRKTRP